MAEYIEREAALNVCKMHHQHCLMMHDYSGDATADNIKTDIETIPAADVVEVVRCYKCKYWAGWSCRNKDGLFRSTLGGQFCSAGKRKGEGE